MLELRFIPLEDIKDVDAIVLPCSCDGELYSLSSEVYSHYSKSREQFSEIIHAKVPILGNPFVVDSFCEKPSFILNFPIRKSWSYHDGIDEESIENCFKNVPKQIHDLQIKSIAIPVKDFYTSNESVNYHKYIKPLIHKLDKTLQTIKIQAIVTPFARYGKGSSIEDIYMERSLSPHQPPRITL